MLLQDLEKKQLIHPPKWLSDNTIFLTKFGSEAYGVTKDDGTSDNDLYGICIPKKEMVFPHLIGEIIGFGYQQKRFEQYQQHHVYDAGSEKQYDITIFNIVKFFQLAMDNNPNVLDSLFVPQTCIVYCNSVGNLIRENRKIFLHKGAYHRYKGYAYSQRHKLETKVRENDSRAEDIEKYGYDLKYAFHLIRLLMQAKMILVEHDIDLQRNREQLKSIRRGEWTKEQIIEVFDQEEKVLEMLYGTSTLRHGPDKDEIRQLLIKCLEMHYGNIDNCVKTIGKEEKILRAVANLVKEFI